MQSRRPAGRIGAGDRGVPSSCFGWRVLLSMRNLVEIHLHVFEYIDYGPATADACAPRVHEHAEEIAETSGRWGIAWEAFLNRGVLLYSLYFAGLGGQMQTSPFIHGAGGGLNGRSHAGRFDATVKPSWRRRYCLEATREANQLPCQDLQ